MKGLVISPPLYKSCTLPPSSPFHMSSHFIVNKNFLSKSPISLLFKLHKSYSPMATCIDTSRNSTAQRNSLCRDPNRSQNDDNRFKFATFCRSSYPDQLSCVPISQNRMKTTQTRPVVEYNQDGEKIDLWLKMQDEARSVIEQEPILSNYYFNSILSQNSLPCALANHLSIKLSDLSMPSATLYDIFTGVLIDDTEIMRSIKDDLQAVKERDPACISYVQCFLNFKGFLACQAHRVAHKLWSQGRKILALLIQNRVSEVFAVDIHPGAKIGHGILLDHATGVVVGETAVIGNNVSILHNVTLGGTGKASGDRHPKIGDGVLIGAGTCILGNIKIGDGAKIGAGSVVIKDVPPRTTALGNPARLIGGKENPIKLDKIPSFTMDHTSNIPEWSDYVI